MNFKTSAARAVSGILACGILLTGGMAFAGSLDSSGANSLGNKRPVFQETFDQLVKDGVITQAQAETIKTKLKANMRAQRQQRIVYRLKALVANGTITQEQSTRIQTQLEASRQERRALFAKTKGMTKEARQQYLQENKAKFQSPLSKLVKEGVITQDQANAIFAPGRCQRTR